MKKILVFLISFLLCMSMAAAAFAADAEEYIPEPGVTTGEPIPELTSFPTAGHLWTYWQSTVTEEDPIPYPDYITGAWSTDGGMENLTFGVTKDEQGEAGKQEILKMVENDATVSFTYQSYPYCELWAIQQELTDSLGDATGACGIGIYEMENHVHIDIDTNNKNSEAFIRECFETYGDRIVFEHSDGVFLTAEEGYDKGKGAALGWIILIVAVMMIGTGAFLLRRKFAYAGRTDPPRRTSASLRDSLKNDQTAPPEQVFRRIMDDIEK